MIRVFRYAAGRSLRSDPRAASLTTPSAVSIDLDPVEAKAVELLARQLDAVIDRVLADRRAPVAPSSTPSLREGRSA